MRASISAQAHLEYRPSGFHWRRRLPRRVLKDCTSFKNSSLLFSLRSHVLPEAKTLAQKLTLLSDIAFAGVTERTMAIAPDMIERLLMELCRFLIEAADAKREMAPQRTIETATYDLACANAAVATMRHAIATRDRSVAQSPLREVAVRLGLTLDETDSDWQRLAFRALRVMLDAEQENLRRDQGDFGGPSSALLAARSLIDTGTPSAVVQPIASAAQTAQIVPRATLEKNYSSSLATAATMQPHSAPQTALSSSLEVAAEKESAVAKVSEATSKVSDCPDIMTGAELYIDERCKGYRTFKPYEQPCADAGESWACNSAPNARSTASLFARIIGNKSADQVSDDEMQAAWEIVARLPRNYQAKTSKISPQEAADDADATERHNAKVTRAMLEKNGASPGKIEFEILKGRIRRLRTATIYRHIQDLQRICVYLKKRGLLTANIMEDHIWDSAELVRRDILEEDNERLTWFGKLDGLFRSSIYQTKLEDVGDPMFWAPLIAVHMGLRSEEILQLYLDDIQIIDEIPCIVLKQGPGQRLKSQASRRTVPIHDNLLKLGFMQLVALRRREGEPRLFPWLERSKSKKTFTENFSKRFTKYRQDHKIYDNQRDFHSLRTTFNDLVVLAERQDSHRRALMGHVERDVGITNYNPSGFSMKTLQDCVNAVAIDISMIPSPFTEISLASVTDLASRRAIRTA